MADPKKFRQSATPIELQPADSMRVAEIFFLPNRDAAFSGRKRLGYYEDIAGARDYARLNGYSTRECTVVPYPDTLGNTRYYELASLSPRSVSSTPSFPIHPDLMYWNHENPTEHSTFELVREWYVKGASATELAIECERAASYIMCLRGSTEQRSLILKNEDHRKLSMDLLQFAMKAEETPDGSG